MLSLCGLYEEAPSRSRQGSGTQDARKRNAGRTAGGERGFAEAFRTGGAGYGRIRASWIPARSGEAGGSAKSITAGWVPVRPPVSHLEASEESLAPCRRGEPAGDALRQAVLAVQPAPYLQVQDELQFPAAGWQRGSPGCPAEAESAPAGPLSRFLRGRRGSSSVRAATLRRSRQPCGAAVPRASAAAA